MNPMNRDSSLTVLREVLVECLSELRGTIDRLSFEQAQLVMSRASETLKAAVGQLPASAQGMTQELSRLELRFRGLLLNYRIEDKYLLSDPGRSFEAPDHSSLVGIGKDVLRSLENIIEDIAQQKHPADVEMRSRLRLVPPRIEGG